MAKTKGKAKGKGNDTPLDKLLRPEGYGFWEVVNAYEKERGVWTLDQIQAVFQLRIEMLGMREDDKATGLLTPLLNGLVGLQKLRLGYIDQADSVTINHNYHAPVELNEKSANPDAVH